MDRNGKRQETEEENPILSQTTGMEEKKRQALEVIEEARGKEEFPSFASQLFMGTLNLSSLLPSPNSQRPIRKKGMRLLNLSWIT